jgi:hypothetical protein
MQRGIGRLRARASSGADSDATAWAAAVTANSGTYSAGTLTAINDFCVAAKANGYWADLLRINPFAGDQLAAALVPLKAGAGDAVDTSVSIIGGDYTEATGITTREGTHYLRTGFLTSSLTVNDTHYGIYDRTSIQHNNVGLGSFKSGQSALLVYQAYTGGGLVDMYDGGSGRLVAPVGSYPTGMTVGVRSAATVAVIYRNGVAVTTANPGGGTFGTNNLELYIFTANVDGSPGGSAGGAAGSQSLGGYFIGSALTAQQAADFYTDWQALMTALGRNV